MRYKNIYSIYLDSFFFFIYFIMTNKVLTFGSRIQVYRGHAKKTSGGLTKSDLMMNKHGRVVSKAKHFTAKKEMRLLKHGYGTKKGKFGYVKVGSKSRKSRSRKMKGGMMPLSPLDLGADGISGAGITDFGIGSTDVQMRAGMSGGSMRRAQALALGRAKARSRGMAFKSKGKGLALAGGTMNRSHLSPESYPLSQALTH